MKVVVVEPAGKGGMIHYAFQLCRAMAAAGAEVTLVTAAEHYELEPLQHPFEVMRSIRSWDPKPAGPLASGRIARALRKLRRGGRALRYYYEWLRIVAIVRRLRPDVVQLGDIRFPFDLLPLLLLRRHAPLFADICHNVHPFAAGGRSGGLFDRSRVRRFFYRRIYALFDLVFVHFERNRAELEQTFGIPRHRTGVIVHGNEELFGELRDQTVDGTALRQRLDLGDSPVVLFFGTLSRYKGTDVLLRAFPAVHRETGARLVLAGFPFHDFDLDRHRELACTLGVDHAVTWVPEYVPTREVAGWMELADVIVFPYRDIYQSGALHVAQTFGVPIVASSVGAMPDVIEHERSGLLVPPDDHEALTRALIRILSDRKLAAKLGDKAAADARGPFSWDRIARVMLSAYGERNPSVASAPEIEKFEWRMKN